MILFGTSLSPYVRKVLAFASEKGIDVEVRPIALGADDAAFRRISPLGKMPALIDDDYELADSSAIVQYFEALRPDPNLIPLEPRARGKTIWFDEWADTVLIGCGGKMFFNRIVAPRFLKRQGDLAAADSAEKNELPPMLDYLEGIIPASGFLVDDRLTLADLAVASPFVNFAHLRLTLDAWPRTMDYVAEILARPSFASLIAEEKALFARSA